jgi:two-component sensor histidine kinase
MNREITPSHDVGASLAIALVTSSNAPVLLLDDDLRVVAASVSFCLAYQIDPLAVVGCTIAELGGGAWSSPKLASLLNATVSGNAQIDAYEMDHGGPGGTRRLVLNAQKLVYGLGNPVRLLLSVADVTDARLAEKLREELARDKAILQLELQHRVANSLQIIASVLMQSARRVQSEETRLHLHEAHQRVMSVASLQKQLSQSRSDDVVLRSYLKDLCASIGASMIRDHNHLKLEATTDDSVATADVSVSLGLIVTELVINALKHAFPDDRGGKISVDYHSDGPSWTMSVGDDGVGMPKPLDRAAGGLGTSIVTALANQLKAEINVSDNHPGTLVSIVHDEKPAAETPKDAVRAV